LIKVLLGITGIFLINILLSNTSINGNAIDNRIQKSNLMSNQTVQWNTYENTNYGIKLKYPNNWVKWEGDIAPGDYVTNIVLFKAPFDTNNNKIKQGSVAKQELKGHQYIRLSVYHPVTSLQNTQHDLDLYLEDQLNAYKVDKNPKILEYTSHNLTLGGINHPAFKVHLTLANGKYKYEQLRIGTISNGNVYFLDLTVFPNNFQPSLPIFQEISNSLLIK
jgi:hypothetical protein